MKFEVDLPADLERRLSEKASRSGADVAELICIAVGRFVDEETLPAALVGWSAELEIRRTELIDKDISGTATATELAELRELDRLANEHFDRVAPPPLEGARQLHEKILQNRGNGK